MFTTIEFIEFIEGRPFIRDIGTPVGRSRNAKIGKFIARQAVALGLRRMGTRRVPDSLGGWTTTAVWDVI